MDEERFNGELRKFLKKFGVTAQREIERAVWEALENGTLEGNETLTARAHLVVDGVPVDLTIEEEMRLA